MEEILVRKIERRNPFRIGNVPLLARLYRYPLERWASRGKQILFGAPNLLLFSLLRRLTPFKPIGTFRFRLDDKEITISFDARNTQFQALYRADFAPGYEPELTALFDVIMPETGVFYDIGSNWGFFSLFVASKPGFRGKILAFEPFPSTFADLASTVTQAGLAGRIQCYPLALSDHDGTAAMRLPDFTHSGLAMVEETKTDAPPKGVKVAALDSLSLEAPSLLKIDAEGSEGAILVGAQRLISQHQPLIVFENWRSFSDIEQTLKPLLLLRDLGYVFFHPCWLRRRGGLSFFIPAENPIDTLPTEVLALVPLTPEDRFLRHDQVNIFACPMNSLPKIRSLFEKFNPAESGSSCV